MIDTTVDNTLREGNAGNPPALPGLPSEHPVPRGAGEADAGLFRKRDRVPDTKPVWKPAGNVFRKTELHGAAPPVACNDLKKKKKRTLKNLQDPAAEIPLRQFETAFREFLCSLVWRQDRIRNEALLHVSDLQQQIDVLESRLNAMARQAAPGSTDVTE